MNFPNYLVYQTLKDSLPLEKLEILEIGCGDGHLLSLLKQEGATVLGAEQDSKKMVEAKKLHGIDVVKWDISTFLPETMIEKYDIVIMVEVLEHIDDFFGALRNVNLVLKQSGLLVLTTPNSLCYRWLIDYITGTCPTEAQNIHHLRFFSRKYVDFILDIQGFKNLKSVVVSRSTGKGIKGTIRKILENDLIFVLALKQLPPTLNSNLEVQPPGAHSRFLKGAKLE